MERGCGGKRTAKVSVLNATPDPAVTLRIDASGSVSADASDVDTLVLFRNGFEVP